MNGFVDTFFKYDVFGNPISITNANGHTTLYDYNHDGSNYYAFPSRITNALNQWRGVNYDYGIGKPIAYSDWNGVNTTYSYNDPLDRITAVQQAAGWNKDIHTHYVYPSNNQTIQYTSQISGWDLRADSFVDGLGRSQKTQAYEDGSHYIETTQSYDALGRVAAATNASRPGDGLAYPTSYQYDALGRVIATMAQDGSHVNTSYNGTSATVTDQAGVAKTTIYDALGRLVLVQEDPNGSNVQTTYQYDSLNNLTGVTQGSQQRTFTYDSLSRLVQATNPENGTTSYTYDPTGNLQSKTDNRGIRTNYYYDALERLSQKTYSDGTPTVNYAFDNTNVPYGIGRLTQVSNGVSLTNITAYDAIGEITDSQQSTAGDTYSFHYTYNLSGQLTSETYPSGRVVTTGYDQANRTAYLQGSLAGTTTNYVGTPGDSSTWTHYWPHGEVFYFIRGNSIWHAATFNQRLQPTESYESFNNTNSSAQMLFISCPNWGNTSNFGLYDLCPHPAATANNGNLQGYTEFLGGPGSQQFVRYDQAFTYDSFNRLTNVSDSGYSRHFHYDQWGNMSVDGNSGVPLYGTTPQYTNGFNPYNPGNNKLVAYPYDAAGNQTAFGSVGLSTMRKTGKRRARTEATQRFSTGMMATVVASARP